MMMVIVMVDDEILLFLLYYFYDHLISYLSHNLLSHLLSHVGRGHHLFSEFSNNEFSKGDDRTLSR